MVERWVNIIWQQHDNTWLKQVHIFCNQKFSMNATYIWYILTNNMLSKSVCECSPQRMILIIWHCINYGRKCAKKTGVQSWRVCTFCTVFRGIVQLMPVRDLLQLSSMWMFPSHPTVICVKASQLWYDCCIHMLWCLYSLLWHLHLHWYRWSWGSVTDSFYLDHT